jgi:hypothetical protein
MKKVFSSNSELIHAYSQQTQFEGRGGSVFFYGKKLYSYGYHYLLCEFITDDAVLINNKGYSNSTSKHINITIGATSQYKQFYTTNSDINLVYDFIIDAKGKLATARKPEIYISNILSKWNSLNEYISFRGWKKYSNTDEQKKFKELAKLVNLLQADGGQDKIKEYELKKLNKIKLENKKKTEKQLNDFLSHKINWFRVGNEDYIRISIDKEYIETSQGVKVPIDSARVLYKMILSGKEVSGVRIENYTVNSLNGHLVIGCHQINIKNMHNIGKQIINI